MHIDAADATSEKISWASATRSLRKLKQRIMAVGGKSATPQHETWRLDDASQWEALWAGEDAFWKNAASIRAAGLNSILALQQVSIPDSTLQVPRVTREQGSRGHQHFRIAIPRGIQGISAHPALRAGLHCATPRPGVAPTPGFTTPAAGPG